MAVTITRNYVLLPETVQRIDYLAKSTFRSVSDVIDWVVDEAWQRMEKVKQQEVTVEQVLVNPAVINPFVEE
jgi:predicted DNA-binding protein